MPAPALMATPRPPMFTPSSQLSGRLVFDFALGDIWSVEVRTGVVSRVATNPNVFPTQATMLSVGKSVAYAGTQFVGDSTNGRLGIYVDNALVIAPDGGYSYQDPTWASDGKSLFAVRVGVAPGTVPTGSSGLVIQRANVSTPISLTTILSDALLPTVSPDGRRLAYVRVDVTRPLSPTRSLRLFDLITGADREVLASDQFFDVYGPRWLNDRQLIFAATHTSATGRAPKSDALTMLADSVFGQRVAQAHSRAHSWIGELWRIDIDVGGLTRLAPQTFSAPIIAPSPDRRFIAVLSMDGMWVMNAAGGDLQRISDDGGNGSVVWVR